MGKATRWIRSLLGMKKEPKQSQQSPPLPKDEVEKVGSDLSTTTRSKERRRWSFGKSVKGAEADRGSERGSGPLVGPKALHNENYGSGPESEQNKHAIAVAAATAAAADAAVAAAHAAAAVVRLTSNGFSFSSGGTHKPEIAAIRIQTAFRGYLARKALSALKGLVKLQALVRGHIVRKQATETLKCMQALIRVQSRVRARRARKSDEGQAVQAKLLYRQPQKSHPRISDEGRNMSSGNLDDMGRKVHSRTTAPVKFDKEMYSEYHHQEMESSSFDGSAKIVEMDTGKTKLTSKKWMESISDSISVEPSISSTTSASHYPPRPNHVPQISQRAHSTSHYKSSGAAQASHEMTSQVSRLSIPRPPSDLLTTLTSQDISPYLMYADSGYGEDNTFSTAQSSPQFVNSAVSRHAGKRGPFTPRSEYAESVFEGYSAFPNYMANTQSSKAKVRSQSAPKQRPSSYEKNGLSSRRRMSLQGVVDNRSSISSVRMQRSSSVAPSMRNEYQYPGPFRLDKSTISQRHDEFDMASIASGGHY